MVENKKVLIVDDDLVLNEMYGERLEAEGFEVISAIGGEQALKKVSDKPAVIILDVMMPKINGMAVLKELRENSETKDIPVIVLTALIQEVDEIKKLMTPKDSYLIKSKITPAEVVESVKKAIS